MLVAGKKECIVGAVGERGDVQAEIWLKRRCDIGWLAIMRLI